MRYFSIPTAFQALTIAAALTLLAGCSGAVSSAITTTPMSRQEIASTPRGAHNIANYYGCPATGTLVYAADFYNNYINVYNGQFPVRHPCAEIGGYTVDGPEGMYVDPATHDLYVANWYGSGLGTSNVDVIHRGQITAYNTYNDPTLQHSQDVTVASDGTVIVSNVSAFGGTPNGSISTWIGGPNGGRFVGNFPMTNASSGGFITVKKNGTVYFSDVDATSGTGALWTVSCPAGRCGTQTQVQGVTFGAPGGMAFDDTGDLLVVTTESQSQGHADIFELPNPKPKAFALFYGPALGVAFSPRDRHFYVANLIGFNNSTADEFTYPGGQFVREEEGNLNGGFTGIAVDP
jgi:secreted PhoX family phosphatase